MKLRISGAGFMALGGLAWLAACSSSDPVSGNPQNIAGASPVAGAPAAGSSTAGATATAAQWAAAAHPQHRSGRSPARSTSART
jgi:hypothetical protein